MQDVRWDKDATEPANKFALFCVGEVLSVASREEHSPEVYENRMMVFNILISDILLWYIKRKRKFRPSVTTSIWFRFIQFRFW